MFRCVSRPPLVVNWKLTNQPLGYHNDCIHISMFHPIDKASFGVFEMRVAAHVITSYYHIGANLISAFAR